MRTVDIIASGYEWICLDCGTYNKEIEITEFVECKHCKTKFQTEPPEHAYS